MERLSRVSAVDVRRSAEAWLTLENATLIEYVPEGEKGEAVDAAILFDTLRRVEIGRAHV